MRHSPDLSCMVVDLPCFSMSGLGLCFLAIILSEACFNFLTLALYPSLFCHLHLCPDLSFHLSIVFGSFWLASLFLQVSSLFTKIKDLRGNPGLPLPALLAKKFSCCVSYCLVEVGGHGPDQHLHLPITCISRSIQCGCFLIYF